MSDEIYTKLTGEESVHLSDYPKCNNKHINKNLEEKMDLVIELISYLRNIREEAKIKVRQPISEVIIETKYKEKIGEFEDLFKEELNVKNVIWTDDMSDYINVSYKPNFKVVGKLFGSKMSSFTELLKNLTPEDEKKLDKGELEFEGNLVDPSYVLKDIVSKTGYQAVMLNYKKVVINTTLTQDLINEGIAREIVSKIQNLRKTSGFDITDRITMEYSCDKEVEDALIQYKDYVMDEVLAVSLDKSDNCKDELKINEYTMYVTIKQVK